MISIERSPAPPELEASRAQEAYTLVAVVRALWTMQHGKCCYCELKIPEVGLGKHVEHHRPKATYDELRNDWTNLLLACPQCNGSKSDDFPLVDAARDDAPLLIDPSDPDHDPEEHLEFIVDDTVPEDGFVRARDSSRRGTATIETTGIGEVFYIERRLDHLDELRLAHLTFLKTLKTATAEGRIEPARTAYDNLMAYADASQRMAAVARRFLEWKRVAARFAHAEAAIGVGGA